MLRTKQLSVSLPNKRGQLARMSRCLAEAKVNVIALSVLECTESGVVRLVVDKPEEAAKALKQAGMTFNQTDVLLVALPNKVGVLAEVSEKLAESKVNVNFVYGSTGTGRGSTFIVIGCTNMATAQKVLAGY